MDLEEKAAFAESKSFKLESELADLKSDLDFDFSRMVWVYALKSKDEVLEKVKNWKTFVENQTGLKVKTLRTDNGLEYCNKLFEEFCEKNGIQRHKTVTYTP